MPLDADIGRKGINFTFDAKPVGKITTLKNNTHPKHTLVPVGKLYSKPELSIVLDVHTTCQRAPKTYPSQIEPGIRSEF